MTWMLVIIIFTLAAQDTTKKLYSKQHACGDFTFAFACTLVALLFFAVTGAKKFNFSRDYIIYAILFGISYSVFMVFSLLAVRTGPLSLSALIISCSLVLPTLYGLMVLNESFGIFLMLGLGCLLLSLLLVNMTQKGEIKKVNLKWLLFVFLAFLGNGFCSVIQKAQQIKCNAQYKNEFMIVALILSSVILMITALYREKNRFVTHLKTGFPFYVICGGSNALTNVFVLSLANTMRASVMFPIISSGSLIATFLISVGCFKEKLTKLQYIGVLLGVISVILLNI